MCIHYSPQGVPEKTVHFAKTTVFDVSLYCRFMTYCMYLGAGACCTCSRCRIDCLDIFLHSFVLLHYGKRPTLDRNPVSERLNNQPMETCYEVKGYRIIGSWRFFSVLRTLTLTPVLPVQTRFLIIYLASTNFMRLRDRNSTILIEHFDALQQRLYNYVNKTQTFLFHEYLVLINHQRLSIC